MGEKSWNFRLLGLEPPPQVFHAAWGIAGGREHETHWVPGCVGRGPGSRWGAGGGQQAAASAHSTLSTYSTGEPKGLEFQWNHSFVYSLIDLVTIIHLFKHLWINFQALDTVLDATGSAQVSPCVLEVFYSVWRWKAVR